MSDGKITRDELAPSLITELNDINDSLLQLQNEVINSGAINTLNLTHTDPIKSLNSNIDGGAKISFTAPELLINLLGKDGDCESVSKFSSVSGSMISLDTDNKIYGKSSLKAKTTHATDRRNFALGRYKIEGNSYYFLRAKAKPLVGGGRIDIRQYDSGSATIIDLPTNIVTDTTKFNDLTLKFLSDPNSVEVSFFGYGVSLNDEVCYDGMMLTKITADEYNNLTEDQLLEKYPYVNGIKPLKNVYVKNTGLNLIRNGNCEDGIRYWTGSTAYLSVENGMFKLNDTITDPAQWIVIKQSVKVKPNTTYTLSAKGRVSTAPSISIYHAINGALAGTLSLNFNSAIDEKKSSSFTTASDAKTVEIRILIDAADASPSGIAYIGEIQLEEGAVALSYKSYKETSLLADDEFCGIGKYADKFIYENRIAKKIKNINKIKIDHNLSFAYGSSASGYKQIQINNFPMDGASGISVYSKMTRYDDTIIPWGSVKLGYVASAAFSIYVPKEDTGWGDVFTPSLQEIDAFLKGWKMNNGVFGQVYDNAGIKTWIRWDATSNEFAVTELPTEVAEGWNGYATLYYALANPIEEICNAPINSLMTYRDINNFSVETGMIWEEINPSLVDAENLYKINTLSGTTEECLLDRKAKTIYGIYKDSFRDNNWTIYNNVNDANVNGSSYSTALRDNVDAIGSDYYALYQTEQENYNSQIISLNIDCLANLKDSFTELSKSVSNIADRLSSELTRINDDLLGIDNQIFNSIPAGTVNLSNISPVVSFDSEVSGGVEFEFDAPLLLTNLLGGIKHGLTVASGWGYLYSIAGATLSITTDDEGNPAQKIIKSTGTAPRVSKIVDLDATHKYYVCARAKGTGSYSSIRVGNGAYDWSNDYLSQLVSGNYTNYSVIITGTNKMNFVAVIDTGAANTDEIIFSKPRAYDLTERFGAGNEPTKEWCDTNLPYILGIQPLMGLNVKVCRKNLVRNGNGEEGINGWISNVGGSILVENGKLKVATTSSTKAVYRTIKVKPNTNYRINSIIEAGTATAQLRVYGTNDSVLLTNQNATFNTGDRTEIDIVFYMLAVGYSYFSFIQLEEGTVTTTYEPYQVGELLVDSEFSGINTYKDKFSYKNGVGKALRRIKSVDLSTLNWIFVADGVGYKTIAAHIDGANYPYTDLGKSKLMKYDGKPLTYSASGMTASDLYCLGNGATSAVADPDILLSIADVDSGWGETYTPTADEIKAYLLGWVMYVYGTGALYSSGTKAWAKRYSGGAGSIGTTAFGAPIYQGAGDVDIQVLPIIPNDKGYSSYKLWYVLSQEYEEVLKTPINSLSIFQGYNNVNLATGIVKRKANPVYSSTYGNYYINIKNGGDANITNGGQLEHKVNRIIAILRNGIVDSSWNIVTTGTAGYGFAWASCPLVNYDTSATYEVIYEALPNEYNHGIVSLIAKYTKSLVDSFNQLVKQATTLQDTVASKANKRMEEAFLLTPVNGWTQSSIPLKAWRDDFGMVHVQGELNSGTYTNGTVIFRMPIGYRPSKYIVERATKVNDNANARCDFDTNGNVTLYGVTSAGGIHINCAFRGE